MVLILDAMGGDNFPGVPVRAAALAIADGLSVALVGNQEKISPFLRSANLTESQIEIHHCQDLITMEEKITTSSLRKKSSMRIGFQLIKEGKGTAFISAGNSGAMLALGMLVLKTLPGIERACIAAMMPAKKGQIFLADAGANVDCTPQQLLQFGYLAAVYLECMLGIKQPKIALLSNGTEEGKGNNTVREAYQMFEKSSLNFQGNIEGKKFFENQNDAVISDGFAGNVLLKSTQGAVSYMMYLLRQEVQKSIRAKIGAFLMQAAFKSLKERSSYATYGGAPLLGLKGLAVVCHGSSSPQAIKQALQFSQSSVDNQLQQKMLERLKTQPSNSTE